jgi:precorrin-3B synthase
VPEITGDPAPVPGPVPNQYGRPCLVAGVRLGRLRADQARLLAEVAAAAEGGTIVVTPWRSLVVDTATDSEAGVLAGLGAAGLIVDPASPWAGVSACAGRPGCAKSLADVRADAATAINAADAATAISAADTVTALGVPGRSAVGGRRIRLHWAGCERRCGQPTGPVAVALAGADGYRVTGPGGEESGGSLAERVARARVPR